MTSNDSSFDQTLSEEPPKEVLAAAAATVCKSGDFQHEKLAGHGMDNRVYKITADQKSYLLRINNTPEAAAIFAKENWCIAQAKASNIPTPELIAEGSIDSWHFVVHEFIPGTVGAEHSGNQRILWQKLGEQACAIHSIRCTGFGNTLSAEKPDRFSCTWSEWVDKELDKIEADSLLVQEEIISPKEQARAVRWLEQLHSWEFSPRLCHGDLSLSNVIVGENDSINVIDWGNAVSHRAPHFDFAEVAVWNPKGTALADFVSGYGIDQQTKAEVFEEMRLLELWRALWAARRDIAAYGERWREATFIDRSIQCIHKHLPAQ